MPTPDDPAMEALLDQAVAAIRDQLDTKIVTARALLVLHAEGHVTGNLANQLTQMSPAAVAGLAAAAIVRLAKRSS